MNPPVASGARPKPRPETAPSTVTTAATGRPSVLSVAAEGGIATLAVRSDHGALRVSWANPAAHGLLELGPDELLGLDLADAAAVHSVVHGEPDAPDWAAAVTQAARGDNRGLGLWQSAVLDSGAGTPVGVQVRAERVDDAELVVWLRPVTSAEQRAEEGQRASEHRFRALAEHAPVGIVLSEAGIRLGYVNDRFVEITGGAAPTLLGTGWLKSIYPEDLPGLLEALDEVMAGLPVEVTVRLLSLTDSQRWVQFRLSPVTTPQRSAGFIGTVEDITARRAWETQLAYQAGHDALTGLANRRSLVEALSTLLTSRRSRDRDAAVLFCDLDGFKAINDTLGHDAGDRVLIEVGQRLTSTARDHDLVARIAGDEFVVVMRQIGNYAAAEAAAGRQLAAMAPPMRIAGRSVSVTASIGIAMAGDYDTATDLLRAADRRMYEAKRAGRGLYRGGLLNLGAGEAGQ